MKRAEDIETIEVDVAVIGSGGAGLMCAIHIGHTDPDLRVAVVSKGAIGKSGCTRMVQGGYNAVLDPSDSIELHFADTVKGGAFLNDQDLAWVLVTEAPHRIRELEMEIGCFFDRQPNGRIHQKAFAGQSFNRTVHRGDLTGIEIMSRLRDQMFRIRPKEMEYVRAHDLVLDRNGELAGVMLLDIKTGQLVLLVSRVTVVATGGSPTMYRIAAPAREKTGDGIAMLYRAGIPLRDMEMMQFHPTGLLAGNSVLSGAVLEEGLRGAGAYLLNAEGERFMARYDPERLERSTRDIVARASYQEIMEGRGTPAGGVLIDISHRGAAEVERRFPGMVERTRLIGMDLAHGPVEVSPTAHFHMGGAIINRDSETSLPGLLVAGEDAGGVHGANRLGGNGVAESTVFGARAGDRAALLARERGKRSPDPEHVDACASSIYSPLRRDRGSRPFELIDSLKETMWTRCGLVRNGDALRVAWAEIERLEEKAQSIALTGPVSFNSLWQEALDLQNQVTVAKTVVASALAREESRGAHYRADYPEENDDWLRYLVVHRGVEGPVVESCPVELSRMSPPGFPSSRRSR